MEKQPNHRHPRRKAKQSPYYESVILHAFPTTHAGQALLRYMLSLEDSDLLNFYRRVKDRSGVLHGAQRPQFTLETLDCEQVDPARWKQAIRLAGIETTVHQPEAPERAPETEDTPHQPEAPAAVPEKHKITPAGRSWSRGEKIAVASIIVTVIFTVIGWIVLGGIEESRSGAAQVGWDSTRGSRASKSRDDDTSAILYVARETNSCMKGA